MNEETIFHLACEKPPDQRSAFLDEACAGDIALRQRLEILLAADEHPGSFLQSAAQGSGNGESVTNSGQTVFQSGVQEGPGTVIGHYKLLQQIGEGGMGVVFMAEQTEPLQRTVALKIIKPGMDTRQVIARFEAERQALAMMDHPNIAKVLDAGTTDTGRPYFVMELVKGIPITAYCDKQHLPIRERLQLMSAVCQAVQHAHQKGIIHRDLKPSNVLVAEYDGRPVPKVIDFGVAKATAQKLTERTMFTQFGQIVGTFEYMSPEQARFNQLDVDTRSDIYSLGVLLYELLAGSTPLEKERLRIAAFDEILRIISEEEPPRPSLRLSTSQALPSISAQRQVEPAKLKSLVRGDLDWIVMKALDKDRARRYETANGLARDVDRYLHDQPVEASPPSALYRFRKFARRNRVGMATALLVSTALVMGTVISTWEAVRATRAENIAEANFQKARAAVDRYFTQVSESTLLDVPGLQPLRMKLLKAALDFYRGFADEHVQDPAVLADLAITYLRFAEINHANDRNDDAVAAIDQALAVIDRLRHEFPQARDQHRRLAGYWKGERRMHAGTGLPRDPQAAFHSLTRLIESWRALADENPEELAFRRDLAALYKRVGDLLDSSGHGGGPEYFNNARSLLEALIKERPHEPQYRADLADCFDSQARIAPKGEAEAIWRQGMAIYEQLVVEFPQAPAYRMGLALSLKQVASALAGRDPAEAEKLYRRAIELNEGLLTAAPSVPMYFARWKGAQNELTELLAKMGRQADAEDQKIYAAQFMRQFERDSGAKGVDIEIADSMFYRAQSLSESGEYQRAFPLFQKAAAVYEKAAEKPDSPDAVRYLLGHCYRYMGGVDNSRKAVAVFTQLASNNPSKDLYQSKADYLGGLAWAESGLGYDLAKERDFTAAEVCYRHAIELDQRLVAEDHGNLRRLTGLAGDQQSYGDMLAAAGRAEEAVAVRRAAKENYDRLAKENPQKNKEPTTKVKSK